MANFFARYNGGLFGGGGGGGGGGVTSLNSETGDVVLVAGTNITITPAGQNITIDAASPASGNLTDAGTDGIVVTGGIGAVLGSGTSLAQHVADTSHNGYLSSTDWNTFNGKQAALTIGNLTDAGTDGIVVTGGIGAVIGTGTSLAQHVADSTHNGYLSSTDWSTFNGKQASGNYITALTGDVTASGPGSAAATLATVNGNVGSFTNASITVNAKGLITAAASGTAPVTSISVATANGLAGSSSGGATPALTLSTTITGILKGNGTAISAAASGTDYAPATSGSTYLKGNGSGGFTNQATPLPVADVTFSTQPISASAIDWSTGNVFTKTLGANTTFTFSNRASGQTIVVRLTNTASNWTVTWPTVKWSGGVAPTMSTGAVDDVYTFVYDGTTVYGSAVQNMS